jgi:Rod binding domain-containing protein
LARTPRAALRPLAAADLSHAARLTTPAETQHDQVVGQARKWVAQTFFGTLLKQMENSPFKSDLFSGGRGGQAFSSLYHQQLTEHMARASGDKLVRTIVRKIEATAAYQKQKNVAPPGVVPPASHADFGGAARSATTPSNGRRDVAAAARA